MGSEMCIRDRIKGKRIAVLAMLSDKDAAGVVEPLVNEFDAWYLAGLNVHRGQSSAELCEKVQPVLDASGITSFETVAQALDFAAKTLDKNDQVVILGSFFTVAQAQTWLDENRLEGQSRG